MLSIDGIDLLDAWSASTIVHLVANDKLRIIATRSSLAVPPPVIAALWREAGVSRIEVPPLDDEEARAVIRMALEGPVESRSVAEVVALSEGNPLVLRELLLGARRTGALVERDGLWHLNGPLPVSNLLHERAQTTLTTLSKSERSALELLAYAGPLPSGVAGRLIDPRNLEALERRGLVTGEGPPDDLTVAASGPLLTTVVERTLPSLTRRRFAAELVAASNPMGGTGADLALERRRTVWLLDSGAGVDAELLLWSARESVNAGDPLLAERLARAAADSGAGTEATLLESWCAAERGDQERAERVLAEHTPLGEEAAMAVAIRQAEEHFWRRCDPEAATTILRTAAAAASTPWRSAADAQQSVFKILDGKVAAAIDAATPLLDMPQPLIGSTAALAAGVALAMADRAAEAETVALAVLERSSTTDLYIDPGVHIISLTHALLGLGRFDDANTMTEDVYRHALSRPGRQAQGWSALMRAQVLTTRGRPSEAADSAREAELIWSGAHLAGMARWSATMAALAHAEEGDATALTAAIARAETYEARPFRLFEPDLDRARAWAAHLAGESDAASRFVAVANTAAATWRCSIAAAAAHDLIRIDRADQAQRVLAGLSTDGPVTEARRVLAAAAAMRDDESRRVQRVTATRTASCGSAPAQQPTTTGLAAASTSQRQREQTRWVGPVPSWVSARSPRTPTTPTAPTRSSTTAP